VLFSISEWTKSSRSRPWLSSSKSSTSKSPSQATGRFVNLEGDGCLFGGSPVTAVLILLNRPIQQHAYVVLLARMAEKIVQFRRNFRQRQDGPRDLDSCNNVGH
jgi:hypothetical protein